MRLRNLLKRSHKVGACFFRCFVFPLYRKKKLMPGCGGEGCVVGGKMHVGHDLPVRSVGLQVTGLRIEGDERSRNLDGM